MEQKLINKEDALNKETSKSEALELKKKKLERKLINFNSTINGLRREIEDASTGTEPSEDKKKIKELHKALQHEKDEKRKFAHAIIKLENDLSTIRAEKNNTIIKKDTIVDKKKEKWNIKSAEERIKELLGTIDEKNNKILELENRKKGYKVKIITCLRL